MKETLQTSHSNSILLGSGSAAGIVFALILTDSFIKLGFEWAYWLIILVCVVHLAYLPIRTVAGVGNIEIEEEELKIKVFPRHEKIFERNQIEGFGTKKILFSEYLTIIPKKLLVPKDEIVIFHRYKNGASEVAAFLDKTYQNKTAERNAE